MSCKGLCILIFDGKTSESASSGGVRGISTYHDIRETHADAYIPDFYRIIQDVNAASAFLEPHGKSKCTRTDRRKWS